MARMVYIVSFSLSQKCVLCIAHEFFEKFAIRLSLLFSKAALVYQFEASLNFFYWDIEL